MEFVHVPIMLLDLYYMYILSTSQLMETYKGMGGTIGYIVDMERKEESN